MLYFARMVSEYFEIKQNMDEAKKAEIVNQRISGLKEYIWNRISDMVESYTRDGRLVIPYNFFWYHVVDEWQMEQRVKLEPYDWRYLLYLACREHGMSVSYAEFTLQISMI